MSVARSRFWIVVATVALAACSDSNGPFDPSAIGDDVVIKVIGTVVAAADQAPLADVSVWVDLNTDQGADPRATTRSDAAGHFSMVFTEKNCSLATELAYRVFARKKGYADGELTPDGNGGLPVLKCVTREQTVGFQLSTQ